MVGLFSQEPAEGGKLDLAGGLGASHDSQGLFSCKRCDFPSLPFPRGRFSRWEAAGPLGMGTLSSPRQTQRFLWHNRNCYRTGHREPGCVMWGVTVPTTFCTRAAQGVLSHRFVVQSRALLDSGPWESPAPSDHDVNVIWMQVASSCCGLTMNVSKWPKIKSLTFLVKTGEEQKKVRPRL